MQILQIKNYDFLAGFFTFTFNDCLRFLSLPGCEGSFTGGARVAGFADWAGGVVFVSGTAFFGVGSRGGGGRFGGAFVGGFDAGRVGGRFGGVPVFAGDRS